MAPLEALGSPLVRPSGHGLRFPRAPSLASSLCPCGVPLLRLCFRCAVGSGPPGIEAPGRNHLRVSAKTQRKAWLGFLGLSQPSRHVGRF